MSITDIGVTGHRSLRDVGLAARQIDHVLAKIKDGFDGPYRLYSSLAEGADRLAARRALRLLDIGLIVPLPLNKVDLLSDSSASSRRELLELLALACQIIELPASSTHAEAYESGGRFILDHVDVLIALWDGAPPRGPGGTGQMVAEARARGMPVGWINTADGAPASGFSNVSGSADASITLENFPRPGEKSQ